MSRLRKSLKGDTFARSSVCKITYNLAHRADDALIDDLARDGIAYVPFWPLGGFNPLQSSILSEVACALARHTIAGVASVSCCAARPTFF